MDETRQPVLGNIDHWLNQWGHPIWEYIYLYDWEACDDKLAEASEVIDGAFSSPDAQAAAAIYLDFLGSQKQAQFSKDPGEQTKTRLDFIDKLGSQPPTGELELVMWGRTLLTVRCLAHHLGLRAASEEEVSDLIEHVPVGDLDHQSISYLAFWAFKMRSKFYLDYCYRLFLTDPFVFMVDFSRQRIRIMRALVYGNCKDEDIEKLIELIPHKMHLEWFEDHIIPECHSQELWTETLGQRFKGKMTQISLEGPKVPASLKQVSFMLNF